MSINHFSLDIPETTPWWSAQQQHQPLPLPLPLPALMEPIQNQNPSTSGPPTYPSASWSSQLYHHHHQQTTSTWLNSHSPVNSISVYPASTHNNNNSNISSSSSSRFNLNHDEDDDEEYDNAVQAVNVSIDDQSGSLDKQDHLENEKEPMFEKPLTPSDVGKLNRLVIPKQHAEKYFPLGAAGDSGESRGLLLSFEDESGKCWRFRYSYWNSSQSYVLTKGWSRYVKEKRLDAGDIVLFERHRLDSQRLFINWRRRQQSATAPAHISRTPRGDSNNGVGLGVGVGWTRAFYSAHPYPTHQPLPYQPDCLHAGRGSQSQVESQTTPAGNSSRVLRLFGVNMECQEPQESGSSRPEYSYMSSTRGTPTHHFYHHQASYSPNTHMDVNQMRNRRG
ncbi:hypothetical protein L6164_033893 [Bauhinia variegata]|uniref:Uncharacterized protein n=1 Tax=Bauhinia variegata TaxID=167791 RepID=A0ACB9KT90_BAUVA|nr:hypothetical protein L6164_033893 [Bauhinia variegata]